MHLIWDRGPSAGNGRNSEGSFIRIPDGRILFAYSRYNTNDNEDAAGCDIAGIYSADEGATWSEPVILITAATFGVRNIMSVSAIYQMDGSIGIYFLIKENDGSSTLGRLLSVDGIAFTSQRCEMNCQKNYYVMNNDRLTRLSDGRLVAPAAFHGFPECESFGVSTLLFSEDDGYSFHGCHLKLTIPALKVRDYGMQEPGIYEHEDGTIRIWARTSAGSQYECFSRDNLNSCTAPAPSVFTSPCSPMELAKDPETGIIYAVYNPIPGYHMRSSDYGNASMGRTPLAIRKSTDDGRTWTKFQVLEDDPERGYCYPAMFFTRDRHMLLSYCRGNADDGNCLSRLGIQRIPLSEL